MAEALVELWWLPLGAGGHVVRFNGKVYEAIASRVARRPACDLYHAALEVHVSAGRFVIEMTPAAGGGGGHHAAVADGPVGARWAGRLRIFRYEVRRWRDGLIPDVEEAVGGPRRLSEDPGTAQCVLDLVPSVPRLVWGRDELRTGDMWNSNSVVAWLLTGAGIDAGSITPPDGGRAPGWHAGLVAARAPGPTA